MSKAITPYSMFETDAAIEKKGVILDYGAFSLTVARAGGANQNYNRVMEAKARQYRRLLDQKTLTDDVAKKILREVYAETIVTAWQNVRDRKGKLLAFTTENVIKVFEDLPIIFEDVQKQASNYTLYLHDIGEQDAKK